MERDTEGGAGRRFSYSNVMSTLSVFLVLAGGTALAAREPVVQSSKDVAKQAIKNRNIKKQNLKGNRFRRDTITGTQVNESTLKVGRPGGPPTGPAGGSLTGNYPNPLIADNAVTTPKIADDAISTAKIAADAVTTPKIADDAISTPKIAADAVTTPKIADDAISTAKIADGAVQTPQLGTLVRRLSGFTTSVAPGAAGSAFAQCAAGERAISGGGNWSITTNVAQSLWIRASYPTLNASSQATGWGVEGENGGTTTRTLNAFVLCLAP